MPYEIQGSVILTELLRKDIVVGAVIFFQLHIRCLLWYERLFYQPTKVTVAGVLVLTLSLRTGNSGH
jgi:hypothetical protein